MLLKRDASDDEFIGRAKELFVSEGTIEVDDGATVSRGDDEGAYVAAWVWVPCEPLNLDVDDESEESEE